MKDVNSYHRWGARSTSESLPTSAFAVDGIVMALEHKKLPIFAHMWHPEREDSISADQIELIEQVYSLDRIEV